MTKPPGLPPRSSPATSKGPFYPAPAHLLCVTRKGVEAASHVSKMFLPRGWHRLGERPTMEAGGCLDLTSFPQEVVSPDAGRRPTSLPPQVLSFLFQTLCEGSNLLGRTALLHDATPLPYTAGSAIGRSHHRQLPRDRAVITKVCALIPTIARTFNTNLPEPN
jgi:hypothetical protein